MWRWIPSRRWRFALPFTMPGYGGARTCSAAPDQDAVPASWTSRAARGREPGGAAVQLSIVGWYHSHPVFNTEPSVRDIENHNVYQNLFQCDDTKLYPYVGFIVGTAGVSVRTPRRHRRLTARKHSPVLLGATVCARAVRSASPVRRLVPTVLCGAPATPADGRAVHGRPPSAYGSRTDDDRRPRGMAACWVVVVVVVVVVGTVKARG